MISNKHQHAHHQKDEIGGDGCRSRVIARNPHAREQAQDIDGTEYDTCPGERFALTGNHQDEPDGGADACCEFQQRYHREQERCRRTEECFLKKTADIGYISCAISHLVEPRLQKQHRRVQQNKTFQDEQQLCFELKEEEYTRHGSIFYKCTEIRNQN